jgi:hypothetical protein
MKTLNDLIRALERHYIVGCSNLSTWIQWAQNFQLPLDSVKIKVSVSEGIAKIEVFN